MEESLPSGSSSEGRGNNKDSGSNTNSAPNYPDEEAANYIIAMLTATVTDLLSVHSPFKNAARDAGEPKDQRDPPMKLTKSRMEPIAAMERMFNRNQTLPRNKKSHEFVFNLLRETKSEQRNKMCDLLSSEKGREAYFELFKEMNDNKSPKKTYEEESKLPTHEQERKLSCSKASKDAILILMATATDLLTLQGSFSKIERRTTKALEEEEIEKTYKEVQTMLLSEMSKGYCIPQHKDSSHFVRILLLCYGDPSMGKLLVSPDGREAFERALVELDRNSTPIDPHPKVDIASIVEGLIRGVRPPNSSTSDGVAANPSHSSNPIVYVDPWYPFQPIDQSKDSHDEFPLKKFFPPQSSAPIPTMDSHSIATLQLKQPSLVSPAYTNRPMGHSGYTDAMKDLSTENRSERSKRKRSDGGSSEQNSTAKKLNLGGNNNGEDDNGNKKCEKEESEGGEGDGYNEEKEKE